MHGNALRPYPVSGEKGYLCGIPNDFVPICATQPEFAINTSRQDGPTFPA
jgi:hypothetical protein